MRKSGYTLVEMAVVIVIIGLLVAGVLGGQELLKEARMKSLVKDIESYNAAGLLFKDKYNGVPGDIRDIDIYFEVASNCTDLNGTTGDKVCPGDGSGLIAVSYESSYFWKHLEKAEMIKGSFTGLPGPLRASDMIVGKNIPATNYPSVGVGLLTVGMATGANGLLFNGLYNNQFIIGKNTGFENIRHFLNPADSYLFDLKYDDGKPGLGKIRVRAYHGQPNCTQYTSTQFREAVYNLAYSKETACAFYYQADF